MNPQFKSFDVCVDAFEVFNLFKDEPRVFFLDSSLPSEQLGRFSFIGFDPFDIFETRGYDSLRDLEKLFVKYARRQKGSFAGAPVTGGMVGYLGYDFGFHLEKIARRKKAESHIPDCHFCFYDCVIAIDHVLRKLHVISSGLPEKNIYLQEKRSQYRLEKIIKKLSAYGSSEEKFSSISAPFNDGEEPLSSFLSSDFSRDTYCQAVEKALGYIRSGDIYQVNLAQKFLLDKNAHPFDINSIELYEQLRRCSPSGFGSYLDCGDFQILSSSPERFLRLQGVVAETRPMKGTRPRGLNGAEDAQLRHELLNSAKDQAELLMITDLERNDLGRVCRYGSVHVDQMRTLESYEHVLQATSSIKGILEKGKDGFDLLRASFPGGSITGCPKIRSMEIIEELEPSRRQMYTGALGYMDFSGNMDFNVLIRTLLVEQERISFHVGSGIVADSSPREEYAETLLKSKAMCRALQASLISQTSKV